MPLLSLITPIQLTLNSLFFSIRTTKPLHHPPIKRILNKQRPKEIHPDPVAVAAAEATIRTRDHLSSSQSPSPHIRQWPRLGLPRPFASTTCPRSAAPFRVSAGCGVDYEADGCGGASYASVDDVAGHKDAAAAAVVVGGRRAAEAVN